MRCGHAADASLAPTETPDIVLRPLTPSAECPGASKISAPPPPNRCSWLVSPSGSLCGLVSSVFVLMPGLLRRLLSGGGAGRCPWSA